MRYNLTLTVDEISFANGLLNITNTVVNAQGRGRDFHGVLLSLYVMISAQLLGAVLTPNPSIKPVIPTR